ncbi:MAG: GTPase HflX [Bacteroidetes bacterium]|nr:GTPase HflX [Bacteroidota bacterium]MCB9044033.1 GTPase HflX [Chitinophagales bacterium]
MIEQKKEGLKIAPEKAILVGVIFQKQTESEVREHLDELAFLANTAGAEIVKIFQQKLDAYHKATFIGTGKAAEIAEYIETHDVDMVIFDDDLSPTQLHNLEKTFKRKVIDRSYLILDIFASRARTAQARTQVELAQFEYLLPRLRGLWTHLERQRGGIGLRGPGEKEIETDRRIVKDKIAKLKEDLAKIERQNLTQRKQRGQLVRISLVGYTNVGKSTLMNLLSKADVFAEDKLFATLDTTTRKVVYENTPFLLSDTVGFIRKLPHSLIESFKSTLDEVRESDILLIVSDLSHPKCEEQLTVVRKTLEEIGANDKKIIYVFNKFDRYVATHFDELVPAAEKEIIIAEMEQTWQERLGENEQVIFISATTHYNIDALRQMLIEDVQQMYVARYPFS